MAKAARKSTVRKNTAAPKRGVSPYHTFDEINGEHVLKTRVEDFCVQYQARLRPGGVVAFFNFELAKEMGLIPRDHPHALTKPLEKKILETFGLVIVNEYDIEAKTRIDKKTLKKNTYMATRYLQLQHEDKNGKSSGDGRSIWNGSFTRDGTTWDISSCGTGATCLSPAAAKLGRNIRTGDPNVSYGCGTADFPDAVSAVLMSEIFALRRIPTERCLAIIRYRNNTSINVRAGRNLLRPAHMFRYLKQNRHKELCDLVDYFIEREIQNGAQRKSSTPYDTFLEKITEDFARSAALFEREYIFCWFDWDGDNILANEAAILDYGSIRQFGLFHKEYRYDDIERFSTNILEQKQKARYIVQTFAQLVDFIKTGQKRSMSEFESEPCLKRFDELFEHYKKHFLVKKIGVDDYAQNYLIRFCDKLVEEFQEAFEHLERVQSGIGVYKVEDGVTSNAIFSMRDFLREYPKILMSKFAPIQTEELVEIIHSSYATPQDLKLTPELEAKVQNLQTKYMEIVQTLADHKGQTPNRVLLEITMRSALLNRFDQITGNGILRATDSLLRMQSDQRKMQSLIEEFVRFQAEPRNVLAKKDSTQKTRRLLRLVGIIKNSREEI